MTRLMIIIVLGITVAACTTSPYKVCDTSNVCRVMTKEEAMDAAEVAKEWGQNSTLQLRVNNKRQL